jgi:NAD(P)-dependent dehydrogenase (short-subunit alcohol dehydrogenase family)
VTSLDGKTAVVGRTSRGLGRGIAEALGATGGKVVVMAQKGADLELSVLCGRSRP